MSIATQWAASRKSQHGAARAFVESSVGYDCSMASFQRDVERQREIARAVRRLDALPYCEREEETLP
jgi:tryptophan synthase beta subunit